MAVSKLWSVTSRLGQVIDYAANPEKTAADIYTEEQYQALRDVLSYAKDEEKTECEFFVEGINCNPATARDQFISVKKAYGKDDGIQAYHGYLSFKEQDISPELAQKIGMEFANEVWGKRFQVVVTTHLNTKHLHCHYVINSVSFVDGKRLWGDEKAWFKFRLVADCLCEKYGLYYNPNPNRSKQSSYYYKQEQAGMPSRYSMTRDAIDEAIAHSTNLKTFDYILTQMGYEHCLSDSRKYWTIVPKGYKKPIRLKSLGENYTEDAIKRRLTENQKVLIVPFAKETVRVRQYRMPTREHKVKKVGGLYGLYLHYCYKLGYLPKYKKQNTARLHYLLKEDLLKLDKITQETRLLGRENISTDEQLFSYKESVLSQIKSLKSISILEPVEYAKRDGTTGISYNVKKVFDVSQTNGKRPPAPTVNRDPKALITVMLDSSPVEVEATNELSYPNMAAFYNNEEQTLYVKRDVGDSVAVAQCVAQELGHAQLSINSDSYSRADMGFQAVCIGYMLCKKYGVDTQNFAINRIPEKLAGKEPKDIRYELSKTRNAMADIHSRVSDELYKKKQERSKDYER